MNEEDSLRAAIHEPVVIVPYDPRWPALFIAERDRLIALFGTALGPLEHIGSTSVPGLGAKPVIDIMAGVPSLEVADRLLPELCRNGYTTSAEFNATLLDRRWLMRHAEGRRTHHLHLVVPESEHWQATLAFRDLLRSDAAIRHEYAALKRALAESRGADREAYGEGKSRFIATALQRTKL